jgi:CheY-like chemotaxis protein
MKVLILEDDTYRARFFIEQFGNHALTITENADEAINYLEEEVFDYLFFDHDLGDGNGCGADVAGYLNSHPTNLNNNANIIIHSWNVPATKAMLNKLRFAKHIPFNTAVFSEISLTNKKE